MCPLRFILLFFSATLAGYLAWKTVQSSSPNLDDLISNDSAPGTPKGDEKEKANFKKVVQDGFYMFVDMASGKYLWRNLQVLNENQDEKKVC
ncbi:hypothetical protein ACHQM5_019386 [Ranunculus cassubicifolius]